MIPFRQIRRVRQITRTMIAHGLEDLLDDAKLGKPVRYLRYLHPLTRNQYPTLNRGERLCKALYELGPIFVKFGQMLSTRRDIIPGDIVQALSQLQDKVPPFSGQQAKQIIEQSLGQSLDALCQHFDTKPLASASIAQVHAAVLHSDEHVVFKVLRPGIKQQIARDIELMKFLAQRLERHVAESRRLKPVDVVLDYEHTIVDELNLMGEAANAAQLKRNFEQSEMLYVPKIYWDYCSEHVMVSERIYGIPIRDNDALNAKEVDRQCLAERGVEIFFTQVFRDNFFHADMHPGNIFVDASNPDKPSYIAIDCGIIGTLNKEDQRYLAENFIAFFNRDYQKVAQLHLDSGWVPANTSVKEFEFAIRTACEPIFGKPLAEISFGLFLLRLFQTARRFNMEVQPQLILLQKTFFYIEGLGRELYPQLDLWQTAKPFLEQWMKERLSFRTAWKEIKKDLPLWREKAPNILPLLYTYLEQSSDQGAISARNEQALQQQLHIEKKRHGSLLGATICIGSCLLLLASPVPILSVFLSICVVFGLHVLWKNKPNCD